jgi:hypothetical protein
MHLMILNISAREIPDVLQGQPQIHQVGEYLLFHHFTVVSLSDHLNWGMRV